MDPYYMRQEVKAMYPGLGWKKKVAKMSDGQIYAIWSKEQQKQFEQNKPKPKDNDDIPF